MSDAADLTPSLAWSVLERIRKGERPEMSLGLDALVVALLDLRGERKSITLSLDDLETLRAGGCVVRDGVYVYFD